MEKILSSNNDDKLYIEILEVNKAIVSWQQSHPDKENMVDLINVKRIKEIVVNAYFQAAKFEKDPTNLRVKEQFYSRVQELAELVNASSYPSTWILKPLPEVLKPLASGTTPTSTAPAGTNPATTVSIASSIITNGTGSAEISTDPYELNKLNTGKPGFTKDGEIIIRHKFKYFRKGNKKGQVYSGQLFVVTRSQACPYIKVLPYKDFTKNIVDVYLNCAYIIEVSGRTEKDKFVQILCTAAESCRPEPLKEPAIYAMYKRKEGNPI
jgi:hypothetical protein